MDEKMEGLPERGMDQCGEASAGAEVFAGRSAVGAPKGLGYEAEQRILSFLRDGDVDRHDSLHSDVQRLYQEMLSWRIACQRWTPGGSEYMDPAYCVEFIQRERRKTHLDRIELAQLRSAQAKKDLPHV